MNSTDMRKLVDIHLQAEAKADIDQSVSVYTDDVEHDVVGWPTGPVKGVAAARRFYEHLTQNIRMTDEKELRRYTTDSSMILETMMTGSVIGSFLGVPGHERSISFRMLHVFEFRDGKISRENIWLDSAAIMQQLAPAA